MFNFTNCRFGFRNRRKLFRHIHDYLEDHTELKIVMFIILLLPMFWILIHFTYTDRIKILVVEKESDIEKSSTQGRWIFRGWDYITKENHASFFKRNRISSTEIEKEGKYDFWIATSDNGAEEFQKILVDHFQYNYPIETSIGLQFYIHGSGQIEVLFRSAFNWKTNTYVIIPKDSPSPPVRNLALEKTQNSGNSSLFCSHIIPLVFEGMVDKIEIKTRLEEEGAFIAIDKIIVTMGKHGGSRNLILTMMPLNWCKSDGYHYEWNHGGLNHKKLRDVMLYR